MIRKLGLVALAAACCSLLLTQCGGDTATGGKDASKPAGKDAGPKLVPETTDELCSDNKDNDNNGLTDCDDPSCCLNGIPAQGITVCTQGTCGGGLKTDAGGTDLCAGVTCNQGETCDSADGQCKCTSTSCPANQVCSPTKRCLNSNDPCVGKTCDPTTPLCVNQGGTAVCQCNSTSCPTGQGCQNGSCINLCAGVTCNQGETCDSKDGQCKCTASSCPAGKTCSPTFRCVDNTDPCLTKQCSGTTPTCVNQGGTAVCQCSATSCSSIGWNCQNGVCVDPCASKVCPTPTPTCVSQNGTAVCQCTPTSCPTGQSCQNGGCVVTNKCQSVTCNQGETCDQVDGQCKCTVNSCPIGYLCSPSLRCVINTDPCSTKVCDPTTPTCVNQGGTPVCQCTATSCNSLGQVCQNGACVTGQDAGTPKGDAGGVKENTNALCSDGIDNDNNGFTDCADFSCCKNGVPAPGITVCPAGTCGGGLKPDAGGVKETTDELCSDKIDNDYNGFTDCDDYSCCKYGVPAPGITVCTPGICGGGYRDGGVTPGRDAGAPVDGGGVKENTNALCQDGIDNDNNGFTDCDDYNCCKWGVPATGITVCTPGVCGGGYRDAGMPLDASTPKTDAGGVKENTDPLCSDGLDNDNNGFTDCADFSCCKPLPDGGSRAPGVTVCAEFTCYGPGRQPENTEATCSDGIDNDGDHHTDCSDFDCCKNGVPAPGVTSCAVGTCYGPGNWPDAG